MLKIDPAHHRSAWKDLAAQSITTAEALARALPLDQPAVSRVAEKYPLRMTPYFLSLIQTPGDPLWKQAVPDIAELDQDNDLTPDPLAEEPQSPVPNLIHRYPDRVVFMVSDLCALYCRHCMRKRRTGRGKTVTRAAIDAGIQYIRRTPAVRDVILSGGDPLMLGDRQLAGILSSIRGIPHVGIIRIHTRMPGVLPARIDSALANLLKRFHPLYVNVQFNHPDEVTHESAAACNLLADAGIPLGSQTVLLAGVNDDPETMLDLMRGLLEIRVRPYYIHHADPVEGTRHFRTSIETGLDIMRHLRGRLSGMGVPQYMIDLPGGGGKVPLLPEYVLESGPRELTVRNFAGKVFRYPLK